MKIVGLLGGTSWPSTFSYYELLNRGVQEHLGDFHSARILLYSIDYHPIKSLYHDGWDQLPELLAKEIRFFLDKKPDCFILCNNTLHRAFDQIRDNLNISIPVFHAGHLAADEAVRRGDRSILLLGTAFTMEDGFFTDYFQKKGISVIIPNAEDRSAIQNMQSKIATGDTNVSFRAAFTSILENYKQVDSVVLACTELPLFIDELNSPLPIINPVQSQCRAALEFIFDK